MSKLHYTVAMQVIRRGGLKNGPKINPKDVDGRVAQLRSQHSAEVAEKAAEGKAKAKAKAKEKGKAGWLVPEDYAGPVTALEHDLGELALGPDFAWHAAFRAAQFVDQLPLTEEDPSKRAACYEALRTSGVLAPISERSAYLRSHVASRLVNARLAGDLQLDVEAILRNAIDHGHPQLAEEAQDALGQFTSSSDKAGKGAPEAEVLLTPTSWDNDGWGVGELQFLSPLFAHHPPVSFKDYKDQLELPSQDWFHEPVSVETRQCLALHAGTAVAPPGLSNLEAAVQLRLEMLTEAVNAFGHLGDAPPYVSEAEAFIQHNAHDAYYPHHEKDYRSLALFAPHFMQGAQLLVLRVSQVGRLEGDIVRGQGAITRYGTVLTHKGHMRHICTTDDQHHDMVQTLETAGRLVREVTADGWPVYLDSTEALGVSLVEACSLC